MIEINLVPDVKQELIKAQKVRSRVITMSILVGILSISAVAVLAIYVFAFQTVRSNLADKSIESGAAKLANVEDLSKTLTIQNQLEEISSLNDQKNIYSRIFDVLNVIIPKSPNDITISDLTIDSEDYLITIEGQAVNSYQAVEIFKKTIQSAEVRYTDEFDEIQATELADNISTSNTSYGEDSSGVRVLRFTLSFNYTEELFDPRSSDVTIAVTIDGNVTDSYLGVPRSIFADRAIDIEGEE